MFATVSHRCACAGVAIRLALLLAALPLGLLVRPAAAQGGFAGGRVTAHCTACNKQVSPASRAGDVCPHCGTTWSGTIWNLPQTPQRRQPSGSVALESLVPALRQRHPITMALFPRRIRQLDRAALRVVEQLPLLAQEAYYVAWEEYRTMDQAEQMRVLAVTQALAEMPSEAETDCVAAVRAFCARRPADARQLAAARRARLATFIALHEVIADAGLVATAHP